MPYFVMPRNVSINSVQGACINFRKETPEFAPEFMRQEIEYRGGVETEAPDPGAPFEVLVTSVTTTRPAACTVDGAYMAKVRVGDHASVPMPDATLEGEVIAVTLDTFTIGGSDYTSALPGDVTSVLATITPKVESPGAASEEGGAPDPGAPSDQSARDAAMHKAFEQMVLDGRSADDIPSVKDTSTAVGFKVTAAERDDAWASFKAGD